jgi:Lar family restriction alleviation protein
MTQELKPCPFCGHVGLSTREGSTFRWIVAECDGCGASCGETRVQTVGEGTREQWLKAAQDEAIKQWNQRAPVNQDHVELVRRLRRNVEGWLDDKPEELMTLAADALEEKNV